MNRGVAPTACRPQQGFEFGETQFDRIEIGTVGREKPQRRADGFDGLPRGQTLVHGEVIQDDEVAGRQRRHQRLLDVGEKTRAIERPIKQHRRGHAGDPQGAETGGRVPPPIGRVIDDAFARAAAPVATDQVGAHGRLVEKHQSGRIEARRGRGPRGPRDHDVSAPLFGRAYRFF